MIDIQNKKDLEVLVDCFYEKVVKDKELGLFFTQIIKVNWELHLPKMYDFWDSVLFGSANYKGNTMQKHFPINDIKAMEKAHFTRWLFLWKSTVRDLYEGENANSIMQKAENIAHLMSYKMSKAR